MGEVECWHTLNVLKREREMLFIIKFIFLLRSTDPSVLFLLLIGLCRIVQGMCRIGAG